MACRNVLRLHGLPRNLSRNISHGLQHFSKRQILFTYTRLSTIFGRRFSIFVENVTYRRPLISVQSFLAHRLFDVVLFRIKYRQIGLISGLRWIVLLLMDYCCDAGSASIDGCDQVDVIYTFYYLFIEMDKQLDYSYRKYIQECLPPPA